MFQSQAWRSFGQQLSIIQGLLRPFLPWKQIQHSNVIQGYVSFNIFIKIKKKILMIKSLQPSVGNEMASAGRRSGWPLTIHGQHMLRCGVEDTTS